MQKYSVVLRLLLPGIFFVLLGANELFRNDPYDLGIAGLIIGVVAILFAALLWPRERRSSEPEKLDTPAQGESQPEESELT